MSRTKLFVIMAGVAAGLAAPAFAADQDRAYAAELNLDAANRTSQAAAAGAGRNNGQFFISDGGDNTLNIGGTLQFRYQAGVRDDAAPVGSDNGFTHGFQYNDVRLSASGTIASRDLSYYIRGNFNRGGSGGFSLEEAYGAYSFENGFKVTWGQFVLPIYRERSVGSEMQLAAERSQAMRFFDVDYSQGIQLGYDSEQFRIIGGFSDGTGTGDTAFNNAGEADYAVNARVEFLVAGNDFNRFNDFTSWRSADTLAAMIGAAVYFDGSGNTNPSATGDTKNFLWTIDASVEGSGWNVYGAFMASHNDTDGSPKQNDFGWVLQGGYFLADQWEIFARYDGIRLDEDVINPALEDTLHFAALGVNYYISPDSHAAKFTGDVVIALTETAEATAGISPALGGTGDAQTGLLGAPDTGEVALRLQLQLMF